MKSSASCTTSLILELEKLMWIFIVTTALGKTETILCCGMAPGQASLHTKYPLPDCWPHQICPGLRLWAYQTSIQEVSTLADITKVVENSSPESRLNIPQLVGLEDGTVLVNTFDWQAHLSPYFRKLPHIKSYQHFSFDAKRPGVVLTRTHSDAEPVSFQLLCDPEVLPPVVCVPALPAPGLATDSRPFCSDEAEDITPQSTTQKRMMV